MTRQFFIVGAQRSGTTYLYKMLDQHRQVTMAKPMRPEPKFFLDLDKIEKGKGHYEATYYESRHTTACGEKSTSYIEVPAVAQRILKFYPDAHLIFMLRHPIRRAISNYLFSSAKGFEKSPIDQALSRELRCETLDTPADVSASPYAYLRRGKYVNFLRSYAQYFDRSKLHIYLSEDLFGNPATLSQVYADIGVDPEFAPNGIEDSVNAVNPNASTDPTTLLTDATLRQLHEYFAEPTHALDSEFGTHAAKTWGLK